MDSLNVSRQRHAADTQALDREGLPRPERADTAIVYLNPFAPEFTAPSSSFTSICVHRGNTIPFTGETRSSDFPVTVIGSPITSRYDDINFDYRYIARRSGGQWYVQTHYIPDPPQVQRLVVTVRWPAFPLFATAWIIRYTGTPPPDSTPVGDRFGFNDGFPPGVPPAHNSTHTSFLPTTPVGTVLLFKMLQIDAAGITRLAKYGSAVVGAINTTITFDIDGSGGYA